MKRGIHGSLKRPFSPRFSISQHRWFVGLGSSGNFQLEVSQNRKATLQLDDTRQSLHIWFVRKRDFPFHAFVGNVEQDRRLGILFG